MGEFLLGKEIPGINGKVLLIIKGFKERVAYHTIPSTMLEKISKKAAGENCRMANSLKLLFNWG